MNGPDRVLRTNCKKLRCEFPLKRFAAVTAGSPEGFPQNKLRPSFFFPSDDASPRHKRDK